MRGNWFLSLCSSIVLLLILVGRDPVLGFGAQYTPATPEWNRPVKAFRVIGNIYYVFLGPHGSFFSLERKRKRLEHGEKANPFIDPNGYQRFIEQTERAYQGQFQKQRSNKSKNISRKQPMNAATM